jgi:hypothetical protein
MGLSCSITVDWARAIEGTQASTPALIRPGFINFFMTKFRRAAVVQRQTRLGDSNKGEKA